MSVISIDDKYSVSKYMDLSVFLLNSDHKY